MTTILTKGSRGEIVRNLQKSLCAAGFNVIQDGVFGQITMEAVMAFQKANGLKPDGIVGAKTWEKLSAVNTNLSKSKRRIDSIIVHCTASPEGKNLTVEDIRRDHKAQGWADIGYHYVVYLDGSIHNGRNVDLVGSHCYGHNLYSIGVVYVGGLENKPNTPYNKLKAKDTRTDKQKKALVSLLKDLRRLYPKAKIYGHRDFAAKDCPCFNAKEEYKNI